MIQPAKLRLFGNSRGIVIWNKRIIGKSGEQRRRVSFYGGREEFGKSCFEPLACCGRNMRAQKWWQLLIGYREGLLIDAQHLQPALAGLSGRHPTQSWTLLAVMKWYVPESPPLLGFSTLILSQVSLTHFTVGLILPHFFHRIS